MYELDDDKICNDKYWVTLTENTHIKSSGEAAKILKRLESDGVLPKMQNHEWARLCIAFCFAKTKNVKDWEQKPGMDGGLEIASFNTCFNQSGKKGEEKFWLAYISQRMFNEAPARKFTKKHLFAYIQLAWHNGAKLLEGRYQKALDYCDGNIVEAKKIFFGELAGLAAQHREGGSDGGAAVTGGLHPADSAAPEQNCAKLKDALDKIVGKGGTIQPEYGGVRYDCLRVQFDRYVDLEKYHGQICSELGIGDDEMRCGRIRGPANTWHINILRPQNTWRQYGKDEFQDVLSRYPALGKPFKLPVCIGLDEGGKPVFEDFATAPHTIVGGETGSGKSVLLRAMLASLFALAPQDETEIAIAYCKTYADFADFEGKPNLWQGRIVSEAEEAAEVLAGFAAEMDERYRLMDSCKAKDIGEIPQAARPKHIVVVIDELADLIDVSGEAEGHLVRLAQKARSAGIYLLLATQRPDAKTLSGRLRDNLPTKIALKTGKWQSSEIILGERGAENLPAKGDHLVKWNGGAARFLHGYNI
ncbi:MAG: FtsK/SpoIIIE domain-containing protein [Neisseria sp.]|nr:FtsK/SpoIIIE domain-containing protein [Neisseria sp.]